MIFFPNIYNGCMTRGTRWLTCCITIILTATGILRAQGETVKELGAPYIHNFTPEEYGAGSQNWAIVQDQRGITYFGNNNGVLEFDGRNWTLIKISNNSYVRALAIDSGGTVYVGSFDEFGFLATDALGKTVYVSLLTKLKKEDQVFNDVFRIYVTSHGIYFLATKKIFRLHNDQIEIIPVNLLGRFGFAINDDLFIVQNGQGLFLVRNGQLQLLPYTERFATSETGNVFMLPFRQRQLFIIDISGGGQFFTYDLNTFFDSRRNEYDFHRLAREDTVLKPFPSEVSPYISKSGNILYYAIPIPGGRYALATLKGGLVIINNQGKLERVINKNRGLKDNLIAYLYLDAEQNLWAALNTCIAYIAINSPISKFDEANGLEGSLIAAMRFKNRLFVGSYNGVFVLDDYQLKLNYDNLHFTAIAPEVREGWNFMPLGNYLLAASAPRALLIDPQIHYKVIGNNIFISLALSTKFPDTIFVGLFSGLKIFAMNNESSGRLDLLYRQDVFKEINDFIRLIAPDSKGNLWLSTAFKGLIHIRFRSPNINDYEIIRYGTDEGLPQTNWNYAYFIDGRLLVGTQQGLYEGIPATPEVPRTPPTRFRPEATFGEFFRKPPVPVKWIKKDSQNRWWVDSGLGIYVIDQDANSQFQLHHAPFAPIPVSEEPSHLDEDGILWVPTTKGLYRFDPTVSKDYNRQYQALIRQVTVGKNRILFQGNHYDPLSRHENYFKRLISAQPDSMVPRLAFKENALIFNFSAPFYEYDSALRFKYILEGFDNSWSDWTAQNMKEYSYLPEGSYTFHVKARHIYGQESSEAIFRFVIAPPWTRTPLAYVLFSLAGLGLIAGIIKAYTFRLRREKERLEKLVTLRTQELKEASLTDPLTGLRNRRFIREILTNDITAFVNFKKYLLAAKDRRQIEEMQHTVFGLLLFDIDHFKVVNDKYGHDAGDQVLQQFAQILKESVRVDDAVLRIGGEEFLIVLKKTKIAYLDIFVAKIMKMVQETDFVIGDNLAIRRTCSIGYTVFPFYADQLERLSFEQTVMIADLGLYHAKEQGRNLAVRIDPASHVPQNEEEVKKMATSIEFAQQQKFVTVNKISLS